MTERQPLSPSRIFSDFYTSAKPWTHKPGAPEVKPQTYHLTGLLMPVSRYMTVNRAGRGLEYRPSLEVEAGPNLWQLVKDNMIHIDHGVYHKLILFDDRADLYCTYQQIIGSRLIAQLDLDSLPACVKEEYDEA